MNPNINYRLWVIMTFECGLINCNKCITLVEMLTMDETTHVCGPEYVEISAPLAQFFHKPKLALKNKVYL